LAANSKTAPVAVGVIVPVHGDAPWLRQALESVLAEGPDDLVVVDDGSPEPVTVPPGCRLVRLDSRGGPAAARDAGLAALRTDLVALCDADDEWLPGKLAAQVEALARHPDAALCFGSLEVVDAAGRATGERWPEPSAPGSLGPAELAELLWEHNPVPTSSVVLRRAALEGVGGFAAGPGVPLASDWELWLRLAGAGRSFVWEPRARIRYRRHAAGISSDLARLAESRLAIHDAHAGLVDATTLDRAKSRDLVSLARGRIRERRYGDARRALRRAAELAPLGARERALAQLVRVPLVREALGRRDPYSSRR
jgi:glycosyltransferase involved in cell wall biosynthesis